LKLRIPLLCLAQYPTKVLCLICIFVTSSLIAQDIEREKVKVDFEGNKIFSSEALREAACNCINQRSDSRSRYESDEFDYCVRKIRSFLMGKAYLKAAVGKPRQVQSETGLKVIIPIEEGLPYRLGNINIQGARLFPPDAIVEMLRLKPGDLASGDVLTDWLAQKLKHAYANRGYIQFTYELEPHFRPVAFSESEGIVDLSVSIEEGRVFTVRRIIFRGNSHASKELLLGAFLLREGDTFNQKLFDDGVKNLNQLGLFEEIHGNRDTEWRVPHSGTPEMDLIFNLKEKIP
jgi:outer membrane protein insertion porin family